MSRNDDNMTSRESGQTSTWCFQTKELVEPTNEGKQMAAGKPAGAPSHETEDWRAVDWRTVNRNVKRLQARIVQATKADREDRMETGSVKAGLGSA